MQSIVRRYDACVKSMKADESCEFNTHTMSDLSFASADKTEVFMDLSTFSEFTESKAKSSEGNGRFFEEARYLSGCAETIGLYTFAFA